jgi:hypothetical protein
MGSLLALLWTTLFASFQKGLGKNKAKDGVFSLHTRRTLSGHSDLQRPPHPMFPPIGYNSLRAGAIPDDILLAE